MSDRDVEILLMHDDGYAAWIIAGEVGCSVSTVYRVIRRYR